MKRKKIVVIAALFIALATLISSCGSGPKGCKKMKYHNSDRKRGLAS
ncbi:MAG: hypothetical protein WCK02_06405 [Bacteroidota bacterium]